MAAEGGEEEEIIVRYIYTGGLRGYPLDETHIIVTVDISVTVIPAYAFYGHYRIIEVICHEGVEKIEEFAFLQCTSLRRVIMPGVKEVEESAFETCDLNHVECDKLETIGNGAFFGNKNLRSINLPSARIVEEWAFWDCESLMNVKFGSKLERLVDNAFT